MDKGVGQAPSTANGERSRQSAVSKGFQAGRPPVGVAVTRSPRYPNLFIAGVAKAATTSWYELLGSHPDVFAPEVKEPRFFNPDLTFDTRHGSEEEYLSLYEGHDEEWWLDGSPFYLYSKRAPKLIREGVQEPRILVSLRDPVDRLYSLHSQMLITGAESIEDFEEALEASEERRRGERLPTRLGPREALYYWDIAHYAPHVRRFLEHFEEDQLKFVRFETFIDDPKTTYEQVCGFLGIEPEPDPAIPTGNPHQRLLSTRLRELVFEPPQPLVRALQVFPESWRGQLRALLQDFNRREAKREPMDPDTRARLVEHCRPDVEELEDLLGWNLEEWKTIDG